MAQPSLGPSTRTVAIVDDDYDTAEVLQFMLESEGHEVHVAYDGEQGLALVERHRPDMNGTTDLRDVPRDHWSGQFSGVRFNVEDVPRLPTFPAR
jgi:FixJ family two-component response regulator